MIIYANVVIFNTILIYTYDRIILRTITAVYNYTGIYLCTTKDTNAFKHTLSDPLLWICVRFNGQRLKNSIAVLLFLDDDYDDDGDGFDLSARNP